MHGHVHGPIHHCVDLTPWPNLVLFDYAAGNAGKSFSYLAGQTGIRAVVCMPGMPCRTKHRQLQHQERTPAAHARRSALAALRCRHRSRRASRRSREAWCTRRSGMQRIRWAMLRVTKRARAGDAAQGCGLRGRWGRHSCVRVWKRSCATRACTLCTHLTILSSWPATPPAVRARPPAKRIAEVVAPPHPALSPSCSSRHLPCLRGHRCSLLCR